MATNTLVLDQPTNREFLTGLGTPAVMLMMLAMIVLPLPATALDFLFTISIALSIMVLMASVYATRPLTSGISNGSATCNPDATCTQRRVYTRRTLNGHTGTDSPVALLRLSENLLSALLCRV